VPLEMRAKALILWYTLFLDPLPGPITLMSKVHCTWLKALDDSTHAGNLKASEEYLKIVSGHRYIEITSPRT